MTRMLQPDCTVWAGLAVQGTYSHANYKILAGLFVIHAGSFYGV